MEPKFQTSFIPKKPLDAITSAPTKISTSTNVFFVAATVIFVVTLLSTGGLFFYKKLLINQNLEADKAIADERAALKPDKIEELIGINSRINSAKRLLETHLVASRILVLMEGLVVKKMRFSELKYVNIDNNPVITITGEVQNYNALAQQQNTFLANKFILNPEFTDFKLSENGFLTVNFTAKIDPGLISYKKVMESTN